MTRCAICGKQRTYVNGPFFMLPRDERRRKLWSDICKMKFKPGKTVFCTDHFQPKDFIFGPKRINLMPGALPSLALQARPAIDFGVSASESEEESEEERQQTKVENSNVQETGFSELAPSESENVGSSYSQLAQQVVVPQRNSIQVPTILSREPKILKIENLGISKSFQPKEEDIQTEMAFEDLFEVEELEAEYLDSNDDLDELDPDQQYFGDHFEEFIATPQATLAPIIQREPDPSPVKKSDRSVFALQAADDDGLEDDPDEDLVNKLLDDHGGAPKPVVASASMAQTVEKMITDLIDDDGLKSDAEDPAKVEKKANKILRKDPPNYEPINDKMYTKETIKIEPVNVDHNRSSRISPKIGPNFTTPSVKRKSPRMPPTTPEVDDFDENEKLLKCGEVFLRTCNNKLVLFCTHCEKKFRNSYGLMMHIHEYLEEFIESARTKIIIKIPKSAQTKKKKTSPTAAKAVPVSVPAPIIIVDDNYVDSTNVSALKTPTSPTPIELPTKDPIALASDDEATLTATSDDGASDMEETPKPSVSNSKIYQCPKCSYITREEPKIIKHVMLHTNNRRPYGCNECSAEFKQKHNLAAHKAQQHAARKVPQLRVPKGTLDQHKITCNICGVAFFTKHKLQEHVRSVHDKKCPICLAVFTTNVQLNAHKLIHLKKQFKCSICGSEFSHRSNYNAHILKHHEENLMKRRQNVRS